MLHITSTLSISSSEVYHYSRRCQMSLPEYVLHYRGSELLNQNLSPIWGLLPPHMFTAGGNDANVGLPFSLLGLGLSVVHCVRKRQVYDTGTVGSGHGRYALL